MLIDGMNFFIRSFTVNPTMDTNGDHVGGTMGFLQSLNKIIRENSPDRVYVIWDGEGGSLRRRSMFKEYKEGRKIRLNREYDFETLSDQKKSFNNQIQLTIKYLDMLPVKSIMIKGTEADDVIAYIWRMIPDDDKLIVSSDRDFYQLINDKTALYVPTKKKYYYNSDIKQEYGVIPENFIFIKSIMGDGSDNIKGIKGIGAKTCKKLFPILLEKECSLSEVFDFCEQNKKENKKYELILKNRELVINNVKLMQLSNPMMDPTVAKSIRVIFNSDNVTYKPIEMQLQLVRDGLQLRSSDFFNVFKEQYMKLKRDNDDD